MHITCTVVDVFKPRRAAAGLLYDVIVVICASFVVALSAQVRIYLPFSPVPVTAQTFAVLMLGALLGCRRGALAMLAYLTEGVLGLPVFAAGAGLSAILGPTGGYLVGFVVAASLVGGLAERGWDRRPSTTVAAMILGNVALYAFGVAWLAWLAGTKAALTTGLLPFIVGDVAKVALAAATLPAGWKLLGILEKVRDRG